MGQRATSPHSNHRHGRGVKRPVIHTLSACTYDLIVVPGTECDAFGCPGPNFKARLDKARERAKCFPKALMVVSGRDRGVKDYLVVNPAATEGDQGAIYQLNSGFRRGYLLIDRHAEESFGNILIPLLAIAIPLRFQRVLVISQHWHALRLQRIAEYVRPAQIQISCEGVDGLIDPKKRERNILCDLTEGTQFFEKLSGAIGPGNPQAAFQWVQENHRNHHYRNKPLIGIINDVWSENYDVLKAYPSRESPQSHYRAQD